MAELNIPVLAYHAGNVTGNSYKNNDRIAFASDLYTLHNQGFKIIPLHWIAQWVVDERDLSQLGSRLVGISCDDGLDQDYLDGEYLTFGPQRSLHNLLLEFLADVGVENQPHAHLTAFVIASEHGRKKIDDTSLNGAKLLNDHWWATAHAERTFSVENHSWDHRHPDIYPAEQANFFSVIDHDTAQFQIIEAKNQIDGLIGDKSSLFCYPWGHTNDYLTESFFPQTGVKNGIKAAFTCEATPTKKGTNPWLMPRYVCGHDWQSPTQLINKILLTQNQI